MSGINIFEDDWRDCLRAHYAYVIRERDTNNEQSLITVLTQTGFTESEILSMRQEIVVELGWVESAPPQIEAPVNEAEPEEQAAPLEAAEAIETGPLVTFDLPESLPVYDAPPEPPMTLLEEDSADAELSAEEEAMLSLTGAESTPHIMALELPLDTATPTDGVIAASDIAPDDAPRTAAPLPERKSEKKKPKKTQQMSLF